MVERHAITSAEILELIEARAREAVVERIRAEAAEHGVDVVVELLAEVQREVGRRWQAQSWSVADEHAASAIVDQALGAVAADAARRASADDTAPTVVVACVEDEWHVIPARMLAEQIRRRGWNPVFLGASAPPDDLRLFVDDLRPVAVALSCSMPRNLGGAKRSVEACHLAGVPAVVGGSAFAGRAQRAQAVGADAWASDAQQLDSILRGWHEDPPEISTEDPSLAPMPSAERQRLVDALVDCVVQQVPPLGQLARHQAERLRENIEFSIAAVEAAALTGDPTIVEEHLGWLSSLSQAQGIPDGVGGVAIDCLRTQRPELESS